MIMMIVMIIITMIIISLTILIPTIAILGIGAGARPRGSAHALFVQKVSRDPGVRPEETLIFEG